MTETEVKMEIDISEIREMLKTNRIAAVKDQQLGMAKHIAEKHIPNTTASEMKAYYLPDGNIEVITN